jgi:LmbE family N-acetylglucosaminyl deacetylase
MISAAQAFEAMAALPVVPLDAITDGKPALIVAPHADDESLGCGGLIAAASAAGHPPFVLILTDGTGSHPNSRAYPPLRLKRLREQEALDAVGILGLPQDRIGFLGLRDTAAPMHGAGFDAAVAAILSFVERTGAASIVSPWQHDPHCDHLAAHLMASAAIARCHVRHLAYPIWGWTMPPETRLPGPALHGMRLDISEHLAAKRRAIAAHVSQYGGLIQDDAGGFQLPPNLLDIFSRPYETFLRLHEPTVQ